MLTTCPCCAHPQHIPARQHDDYHQCPSCDQWFTLRRGEGKAYPLRVERTREREYPGRREYTSRGGAMNMPIDDTWEFTTIEKRELERLKAENAELLQLIKAAVFLELDKYSENWGESVRAVVKKAEAPHA